MEKLLTTRDAGDALGGLHPNDVLLLIRTGRLRAVVQRVRGEGKRPRRYVPTSAIEEYIRSLPEAPNENESAPPPKRERVRGVPRDVREELKRVKQYY